MNPLLSIEAAATPEAFIAALRAEAQRCHETYAELSATWQDKTAGRFWFVAATKLDRIATALEREVQP